MWTYSLLVVQVLLNTWYIGLFRAYTRAWKKPLISGEKQNLETGDEVSLLISLRNEETNLPHLFRSLDEQRYANLQVIFIDDHSEDASASLVANYCQSRPNTRFLQLPGARHGKKQAITMAMDQVTTPWVLCTDADTFMGPEWVSGMMYCANANQSVFVSGPVAMKADSSWFSRWQALEFSGLIAIGAAGIQLGRPTMCNGANLLYQKEAFIKVGGFSGNEKIASGDDQFLMHRIHEQYPGSVHFCMDEGAIVFTKTQDTVKKFVQQRVRWASKNGKFERPAVNAEMVGVWLVPAFLFMDLLFGFYNPFFFLAFFIFFFTKLLLERHFFTRVLPFFKQSSLIKNFWLSELVQVAYVFGIGLLSKFVSYEWKGRRKTIHE